MFIPIPFLLACPQYVALGGNILFFKMDTLFLYGIRIRWSSVQRERQPEPEPGPEWLQEPERPWRRLGHST
jgi:hypothetical protein